MGLIKNPELPDLVGLIRKFALALVGRIRNCAVWGFNSIDISVTSPNLTLIMFGVMKLA